MQTQQQVAMMASPGMGHIIPMLEFAKSLTRRHHHLSITIIIPTTGSPPSTALTTVLRSLPSAISHTFLPPVSLSDLPPNANLMSLLTHTSLRSLPSLRQTLLTLSSDPRRPLSALILDFFATVALDVAADLNIPSYTFFPSPAMLLSYILFIFPQFGGSVFDDLAAPVRIPGCTPVHAKQLFGDAKDQDMETLRLLHKLSSVPGGIILNSFLDLEPGIIQELLKDSPGKPPVYPVGPLVNTDRTGTEEDRCLSWLDEQPRGSVLFVCFGSCGVMSSAQLNELALGLEMSQHRFLWILRSPDDNKVNEESYFDVVDEDADIFDFLPRGFVRRTREMGLVVPSYWVPQSQVLAHESVGGFLTHCGWNSILESVVNGVPLIAWPLFAEQKMNAMLVEDMKVALRPNAGEEGNGLVEREEVGRIVKSLMEGEDGKNVRHRTKELKEAAAKALGEHGSSSKQIDELVHMWTSQPDL